MRHSLFGQLDKMDAQKTVEHLQNAIAAIENGDSITAMQQISRAALEIAIATDCSPCLGVEDEDFGGGPYVD